MNDDAMNDQPLNDTELDARIRALVADAVAETPPAPPMPSLDSPMAPVVQLRRTGRSWGMVAAAAGVAAALVAAVVWMSQGSDRTITPATTDSLTSTTAAPVSTITWPDDLAVIIASERGIERVVAENGQPVVTRLADPLLGDVAFQIESGAIVSQEGLIDVGLGGGRIVQDGTSFLMVDSTGNELVSDSIQRLTDGLDVYVGQTSFDNGVSWSPFFATVSPLTPRPEFWAELGVAGPHSSVGDPPRLFSVSPTGSTIGWVHSDLFVLADGRSFPIPDGSKVWEVDLADRYVALSRAEGPGSIIDLRTGASYTAPAAGRLTISLAPMDTDSPATTTSSSTPVVTPVPVEVSSTVVTAGSDGVWRVVDGVATQLTAEPMSMALQLPDGSVIMQRSSGWSGQFAASDTTLLGWSNGETYELFPQEETTDWLDLYDVAVVNGDLTVLYAAEQDILPDTPSRSRLIARSLDTGAITVVDDQFGGWEGYNSRLHLAETGLIVGEGGAEGFSGLISFAIAGAAPIDETALGLERASGPDCEDCPRQFTVSRDGSTVAWLQGTFLHRVAVDSASVYAPLDLGIAASDLDLGNGFVVISFGWGDAGVAMSAVVEFGSDTLDTVELPGSVAAIVTMPTPPWQVDPDLTAALQGQSFGSSDEVYAAVEAQIEAIRYAAVDPVEPITFTRFVLPDGSLAIAAPNFDDSVPETWFRIGQGLTIGRIEFVDVCRNGTYSTPTHLCV